MRAAPLTAGLSLLLLLGCADLFGPEPAATLSLAQVDQCGLVRLDLDVVGRQSQVRVEVGGALVDARIVDGSERYTLEHLVSPAQRHTVEVKLDEQTSELRVVEAPPVEWRARLTSGPSWHLDTKARPELRIDTGCSLPASAVVRWRWADVPFSEWSRWQGLDERNRLAIGAPPAGLGPTTLAVELDFAGSGEGVRKDLPLSIVDGCVDVDGDGFNPCTGDCDERWPTVHRGVAEVEGNGLDDDCDGVNGVDRDRDGYEDAAAGGDDCNDADAGVHPGALEVVDQDGDGFYAPNGRDDNCSGEADEGPHLVGGVAVKATDCDDARATVNPDATEAATPNGLDDNCDGRVDEGTVAYDDDGDGVTELKGDCDDTDNTVYPGAAELPDCRDQDCDGTVDEGVSRPSVDDGFETNDTRASAHDLGTTGQRRFVRSLDLITRNAADEEWFAFYSQDGDFDSWGISARVDRKQAGSSYRLEVYDMGGGLRSSGTDSVNVGGRWLHDDSGMYELRVRPLKAPLDWCPATIHITAR